MNFRCKLLIAAVGAGLFLGTLTARAAGDSAGARVRALEQEFPYSPTAAEPVSEVAAQVDEEPVVEMAPFLVVDRRIDGLAVAIKEKEKALEAERFSFRNGGTLIKGERMTLKLKYDPVGGAFDILSINW